MAAPTSFVRTRPKVTARWLTEGDGGLVGYSLDLLKDAFVTRLALGLQTHFPVTAPDDAIAAMGRDRRVRRGRSETLAAYAQRLIRWLDDRKTAGNPFALMQKVSEYTGPGPKFRTFDPRGNCFTREVDGSTSYLLRQGNWDWDGRPLDSLGRTRWSRFWLVIYPNGLWTEGAGWGDADAPAWGDNNVTWGSTATPEDVETVRFIVSDWMPDGMRCVNIILAFDNASFDPTHPLHGTGLPDGLWEHWSKNVGGVQVPARLETARYWDGV